jgi:hypothetical protein
VGKGRQAGSEPRASEASTAEIDDLVGQPGGTRTPATRSCGPHQYWIPRKEGEKMVKEW